MRLTRRQSERHERLLPPGFGLLVAALLALFLTSAGGAAQSAPAADPPRNVSPPVITGWAQEGQILRASRGTWRKNALRRAVVSFQWLRCTPTSATHSDSGCAPIAKATDRIYAVRHDDIGRTVRVRVTVTKNGAVGSATSAPTAVVVPPRAGAPTEKVRPTISGPARQGEVLVADPGEWTGVEPIELSFRWRSCTELGGSCRDLDHTKRTYELRRQDVGRVFRVLVVAENSVQTSAALSEPTASVARPGASDPLKPRYSAEPRISGTPQVGKTLRTTKGEWIGFGPMEYTYRWLRCRGPGRPDASDCARISRARSSRYKLRAADAGFQIRAQVTATNPAGSTTATSNPTQVVAPRTPPATAPRATAEPRISGTARVGETLRTTRGTWTGTEPITYAFRWRRCDGRGNPDASNCAVISNANDASYVVRDEDVGHHLRSQVIASNTRGTTTATSNPTERVAPARPTNTARPSISGPAVLGSRVTANPGSWAGRQPITFAFQWLRCDGNGNACAEIRGATDSRYVVAEADVGRRLRVRVTARNAVGSSAALSDPTAVIQAPRPDGVFRLPSGERSIPASMVPRDARLVVAQVRFSPNPVRSRVQPITVRIRVVDTRGFVVRGALVFIRSVPRVTTGGNLRPTAVDGWVTYRLRPLRRFPAKRGNVQFFVKAYRAGDPPLAGVAAYRLVQVRVRTGR